MKAEELRKGNYVQGGVLAIPKWGIYSDGVTKLTSFGIYTIDEGYDKFKPILLNEEWLFKFGFEGYSLDLKSARIHFRYVDGRPECFDLIQDDKVVGFRYGGVRYVHQLQNLYFTLTGKELEIKDV